MSYKLDFSAIKRDITIEHAMVYLSLKSHKDVNGWRASCPVCESEDDLSLNIERNVFTCHTSGESGSVIDLVAHIKGIGIKDAAKFLLDNFTKKKPKEPEPQAELSTGFQPLKGLSFDHEKVQELGISAKDAERLGIGYCSKGYYRNMVVAPIRLPDGHLVAYAAISLDKEMPETLHWPETNVIPLTKRRA